MLLIYGLKMKDFFSDECLKYHSQEDTNKDIMLLEEIRYNIGFYLFCISLTDSNVVERSSIAGSKLLSRQRHVLKPTIKTPSLSNPVPY